MAKDEAKIVFIYSLSTLEEPDKIMYIGKTNNLKKRLVYHLQKYHLKAITLKNNWIKSELKQKHTIIIREIDCVLESEWKFWEIHYISLYKSFGFNLKNGTIGGDGYDWTGRKHSKHTAEILRNLRPKKKVYMYSLDGKILKEFISIREAERKTGLSKNSISACCRNKYHCYTVGGYVFKFKKGSFKVKTRKLCSQSVIQKNINGKTLKSFNSIREASLRTNINRANISNCCKKLAKYKTAGGFIWEYKEKYMETQ